MRAPNPQLAEALDNAPRVQTHIKRWDDSIKAVSDVILNDQFVLRHNSYGRQNATVAALLAYDNTVRDLAIGAGINIRVFDDIVAQVRSAISTQAAKPPPAHKIAGILCKLTGVPF